MRKMVLELIINPHYILTMLTKTDLKDIGNLLDERLDKQFKIKFKPIKSDISKIRKDIDVIISLFDREYINLRQRIERIEEHLNLPNLSSRS